MRAVLARRRAIIVGAGQAGIATAAALIQKGLEPQRDFAVVDASDGTRRWASHWHSLTLLSDAHHSALAGYPIPGAPLRHPTGYEMAEYLASIEAELGIEPQWGVRVTAVSGRSYGSTVVLETSVGQVQTRSVVGATGAAARPRLPAWARELTPPGPVLHSSQYLYPRQLPPGEVLVVGGGNAGVQLARELAPSHAVSLAVRARRRARPWAKYHSAAGGAEGWLTGVRRPEPLFTDSYAALSRSGVRIVPAVAAADGAAVTLADGSTLTPTSVILATGFVPGDEWLPAEIRVEHGVRTRTSVSGLFLVGFPRHGSRHADTIRGVWRDARAAARQVLDRP